MSDPVVTVGAGRLRGVIDEGVASFRGIPYARAPVGALRFLAPAEPERWDGTRDATSFGPAAPQTAAFGPMPGAHHPLEGDDYLNLNVFTPDPATAGLPVLVWIHGGGYVAGCAESDDTRGTRFARDGLVHVSVHYRLAVEGFLEMDGAPPNRAVLDWVAALEWVQNNVASFGGDPANVTIMGESAGSAACGHLMCEPSARGLFRRAICMSGVADTKMPRDGAVALSRKMAAHLGCEPTREGFAAFAPAKLLEAYTVVAPNPFDAARLVTAADPPEMGLRPFVDGEVVTVDPREAFASRMDGTVELLAGSTTEEMNGIVKWQRSSFDEEFARRTLRDMGLDEAAQRGYMAMLPTSDPLTALEQAVTDRGFRGPLANWLEARLAAPTGTYGYQFAWRSPLADGMVGAAHALDVAFAFDCLDARTPDVIGSSLGGVSMRGENPPQSLAGDMHGAFVRFATTGDPGWPRYDRLRRAVMVFDVPSAVAEDPLRSAREFFTL